MRESSKLKLIFKNYLKLVIAIYLFALGLKIFETISVYSSNYSNDYFIWQLNGLLSDLSLISVGLLLFLPIYFMVSFFNQKIANLLLLLSASAYFILHVFLILYFNESLTPLNYFNIVTIPKEEVDFIMEIYGFRPVYLFLLIPISIIISVIIWGISSVKVFKKSSTLITILSSIFLILYFVNPIKIENYKSETHYFIVKNKPHYLLESYLEYKTQENQLDADINQVLTDYYSDHSISNPKYYKYPFFSDDTVKNVLGNYFVKKDTAPNIVFIISESLGKMFSGPNARLGSFTPFLDSLTEHSLYWPNIIANAERTFGAIPNLMAGVPEGETGFLDLREKMPDHLSLPLLLKENNNYQTAFYCGAWGGFNNMDDYLFFQKFDHIFEKDNFSSNKILGKDDDLKNGAKPKITNWGAEDLVVYKESIDFMNSTYKENKPFFNLYLSTSFHKPYAYSYEQYFINKAKLKVENLASDNKSIYLSEIQHFAALMYADYSLQQLFKYYKKREDFENTIFIICGDHSIKLMSDNSRLEKYHVPLLIYSPLLKKEGQFNSVACQKDIPSSLQALLKENFNLTLPEFSISQSNNLDTTTEFNTKKLDHAMMYLDRRIKNYVWNNYFISDGILFEIQENLTIKPIENNKIKDQLILKTNNYIALSKYVCINNTYIPDSIYSRFIKSHIDFSVTESFEFISKYSSTNFSEEQTSSTHQYSGKKSLSSLSKKYLTILPQTTVSSKKRIRLKISFTIHSPSNQFPTLTSGSKTVNNTTKDETSVYNEMRTMNSKNGSVFSQTDKEGWYFFSTYFWVEPSFKKNHTQNVSSFLFTNGTYDYYIDDLSIIVQEF